jgi:hypothetical protein
MVPSTGEAIEASAWLGARTAAVTTAAAAVEIKAIRIFSLRVVARHVNQSAAEDAINSYLDLGRSRDGATGADSFFRRRLLLLYMIISYIN